VDAARGYVVDAVGRERLIGGVTAVIKAATTAFTVLEELPPLLDAAHGGKSAQASRSSTGAPAISAPIQREIDENPSLAERRSSTGRRGAPGDTSVSPAGA
jgi:hypothetical protein